MDFGGSDLIPNLQSARAVRTVVRTVQVKPPNTAGAGASAGVKNAAPVHDEAEAIRRAIAQRNLKAFIGSLPGDAALRRAALRKSFALDDAFREGSLPIVRQILVWQPDALAERAPNSNSMALQEVASEWGSFEYFAQQGVAIANRPADSDLPELLQILLKAGASADGYMDWRPPLGIIATLAPTPAAIAAARMLLAAGAKVDAPRPGAQPPLVFAAQAANGEVARLMLEAQHPTQESLDAALVKTPISGTNPVLAMLLEAGADINTRRSPSGDPRSFITPAQTAASRFKTEGERDLLRLLIRYKADPNRLVNPGVTDSPLMLVTPDVELMTGLLEIGADPNYRNLAGDTALLITVRGPAAGAPSEPSARYASTALLLGHGADPSAENNAGVSPLKATGADDAKLVSLLMAHGATWRLREDDFSDYRQREVPIGRYSWAVLHDKDALAAAMLAHGERPTKEDCGLTYYAAYTGSEATLAALLDHHSGNYAVRDEADHTPLMAAVVHGRLGTVRLLLDHHVAAVDEHTSRGVGIARDAYALPFPALVGGATPLMLAAQMNRPEIAEELIRRGADVNAHDFSGHTALDYASSSYGRGVIPVLEAHGAKR
jgi:ankyrin repeat protein